MDDNNNNDCHAQMRCRSRSCSHASTNEEFFTPGYGLKFNRRGGRGRPMDDSSGLFKVTPDSGRESGDSATFKSSSIRDKLANVATKYLPEGANTKINQMRRQWRMERSTLYSSSSGKNRYLRLRGMELLPIIVMIITLGSTLFTLFIMFNALNNNQGNRNGKYDSIEFAHKKQLEKTKGLFPVFDENGVALGGKKAAIQFAYNMRNQIEVKVEEALAVENEESAKILNDEEIINRLTLKVATDVMKMYENMQKEKLNGDAAKTGEQETKPLEPLAPLDLDQKVKEAEEIKVKEEPKEAKEPSESPQKIKVKKVAKRNSKISKAEDDPFRLIKTSKDEEDPFRFV